MIPIVTVKSLEVLRPNTFISKDAFFKFGKFGNIQWRLQCNETAMSALGPSSHQVSDEIEHILLL